MKNGKPLILAGGGLPFLLLKRWAMRPERRPRQNITLVNRSPGLVFRHGAGINRRLV